MDWHSHIIISNYTVDLHTGSDLTPTAGGWGLAYIFKKLFMTKYRVNEHFSTLCRIVLCSMVATDNLANNKVRQKNFKKANIT